ncbi:MAG: ABC transporter ATP-binding protein [Lachnospiraceae bacterium]|nr:ABC transporter ATP-binding protein [Lachnospiraceae bacterium]
MLEFKDVTFEYSGYDCNMMDKLSFKVNDGEFISIIGASGCGKSTVFRLINGLEKPQSGKVLVDGEDITLKKNYSAYMPQKDLLYPWRTIEKNICLPMEIQKKSKSEMAQRAEEMLKEVGLWEYRNKYPKDLSGGMKQRASFARTLLTGSELLLLDEPFSALDSLTKISLQEWLVDEWQKHKKTILFVTHDVEEALFLSKKIFIIKDRPVTYFEEYEVPLSYPRTREDMKRGDVTEIKEMLINQLRGKVEL